MLQDWDAKPQAGGCLAIVLGVTVCVGVPQRFQRFLKSGPRLVPPKCSEHPSPALATAGRLGGFEGLLRTRAVLTARQGHTPLASRPT